MTFPKVERLLWVMSKLRDPQTGCPWDLKQTFQSIIPCTIEEAYEVADAIENGDMEDIKDELGDLLFQIVFYAQLGKEQGDFDFEAIAAAVTEKLIRRHPHVFADASFKTDQELKDNWQQVKAKEREAKGLECDNSILANIPKGLSPLMRAHKLQRKCADVGFDWQELPPVVAKVQEEIEEIMTEVNAEEPIPCLIEEEIGDLLFAVVNLSRHLNVDAETALRKANHKFERRFRSVESSLATSHITLEDASLAKMETLWVSVKREEKRK